ncbi:MAG TPA: GntR family transcriptional regulator [Pseudolysinimonas sp.]|jgi:DNA-binding GntR family transcriptional regulator
MQPVRRFDTLYEQVLGTLRTAIVEGDIGPGSVLSVPEIATRLGVSRSPAREAILQLQNEGLVSILPRRGAVVLDGTLTDVEQIFQYREPLEGAAAALAARRIDPVSLDALRAALEAHTEAVRVADLEQHVVLDEQFHLGFIEACGNARIIDSLRSVRAQLRVVTRRLSAEQGALSDDMVAAHQAIFHAIETGDAVKAERVARSHVRGVLEFYQQHASAFPARGSGPVGVDPLPVSETPDKSDE